MVEVGTGKSGTRFLSKRYPVTSGLTAGTTKQEGRQSNLVPETSKLMTKDLKGIN